MSSMFSKGKKYLSKAQKLGGDNPLLAVGLGVAAVTVGVAKARSGKKVAKPKGKAGKA
jgi:hypothetical protein